MRAPSGEGQWPPGNKASELEGEQTALSDQSHKATKLAQASASSSSAPAEPQSEGPELMRENDLDAKRLRRACGDTLWTSASILCKKACVTSPP